MNILKVKEAMNQIHIKEEMQEEIITNVKKQEGHRTHRAEIYRKTAAAAAAVVLIFGAAIPIQAGIRHLLKERLQGIPKQDLEAVNEMIQNQDGVEADSFSREYSKEESERMQQMEEAYKNGRFPQQTITCTDNSRQMPGDSLIYGADTGTFYLPDRTMTDEELLQIIDFQYTTDYALVQGADAQKALRSRESEESRLKAAVQEEEGITEQEALQAAEIYLQTEFGLSAEEMDIDIFLDGQADGVLFYHVSYHTQDHQYFYAYGIDLNAKDGSLLDTSHASLQRDRT